MRIFVTGASGWIGSPVVANLVDDGHDVRGLARSDASAHRVADLGAVPVPGELDDLDLLAAEAGAADAVVHLGFRHDFSDFAGAGRTERSAVEAMLGALEDSDRAFLLASGIAGIAPGRTLLEIDRSPHTSPESPRGASENLALGFAGRGVRTISARFAPTVHGAGDRGFVATLVSIAAEKRVSGYIDDGTGRWPAVHRGDAARAVVLGLASAGPGSVIHAIAEEGIPTREIAEAIGALVGVPTVSVPRDAAAEHFGWLAMFFGADVPASSAATRELLNWEPTGPTLLDDLREGHYYKG
ncbi:SDR family oxidoreductase [Schumannella luteola]